MNAASNEEILSMLSDFAKKSDQKMLIGFGASPYSVKEDGLSTEMSWTGSARINRFSW